MLYVFDDCELDAAQCELRHAGAPVPVEPKVFKVLAHLLAHRDRVVTKDELLEHFWPGTCISESALTRCLTKARKAVYDDSVHQRVIKTVHGHGYRFVASVAVRTSAPLAAPGATSPPEPTPPTSPSTPVTPDSPRLHGRVPGERKQVSVLAAGLHGVTALAQAVDAEVLYELLTRAATLWQQAVGVFRFVDQGTCAVPEITQPIRLYTCIGVAPGASRLAVFLHRHQRHFWAASTNSTSSARSGPGLAAVRGRW